MSVYAYLQSKIDEYGMDIELLDMAVSGSRCRGLEKAVSDLDVAVEYRGGENEDALFNAFNEDGFTIGGVKVDINPITEGKTGTLGEYLPGVEAYLAIAIFNQISPERMNGIPSIGINIHTEGVESYEDTQLDIVSGRVADLEILDYVPDITDNPKGV